MSLLACAECGREISDSARRCPQCGALTAGGKKSAEMWTRIVGILAVIAVFVAGSLLLD